eukprot:364139-Chlamydomonas_euryale.AAC.5
MEGERGASSERLSPNACGRLHRNQKQHWGGHWGRYVPNGLEPLFLMAVQYQPSTTQPSPFQVYTQPFAPQQSRAHPRRVAKVASQVQREISDMLHYDTVRHVEAGGLGGGGEHVAVWCGARMGSQSPDEGQLS